MKLFTLSRSPLCFLALAGMIAGGCADNREGRASPTEAVSLAKVTEGTGTIQIIQGGTGQGTVTSSPAGIDCTIGPDGPTGTCEATFPAGTKVKLNAEPAANSTFDGWAPVTSCFRAPRVVVEADRIHSCQPVFSRPPGSQFFLGVITEGSGRVTSSPAGIDCTSDADAGTITGTCAAVYDAGTVITLSATPAVGWMFVGFGGEDPDCNDGVVTLDAATRCTATFVRGADE